MTGEGENGQQNPTCAAKTRERRPSIHWQQQHDPETRTRLGRAFTHPFFTMMLIISYSASAAAMVVSSAFVSYAGYYGIY